MCGAQVSAGGRGIASVSSTRRRELADKSTLSCFAPPFPEHVPPFRRIWSLFRASERPRALALLAAITFAAALETVGVGLILPFISLLNDPTFVERAAPLAALRDRLGIVSPERFLVVCGLLMLAYYVLKNVYLGLLIRAQNAFIFGKMQRVSSRLFDRYLRASYAEHLTRNSAEIQRNVNTDTVVAFSWVVAQSFVVLGDILVALVMTVMLLWISPFATLLAAGLFGGLGFAFFKFVRRHSLRAGEVEQESLGQMIRWVVQGLSSVKETKVLGVESYFVDQHRANASRYADARRQIATMSELPRLFFETVAVGGLLLVVLVNVGSGGPGAVPLVALFAAAAFRLMPAMSRIVRATSVIRHYRPSFDVVHGDLCVDAEDRPRPLSSRHAERIEFARCIELSELGFRYGVDAPAVLDRITFEIPRNQSVAIVGPSGSGKTTLLDILLGILEPSAGSVLVDGVDIRRHLAAWRTHVGYVPQNVYLTDDTLRRNVAFGLRDPEIEDRRVWEALRSAQLEGFVRSLDAGLDTPVGEEGARLSGGQKQRIGIARALYRDPDVLVLDEATSALDRETESAFAETISALEGRKTVILVAHRMQTVRACDRIHFLRDGRVLASGTFDELAATSTEFRTMAGLAAPASLSQSLSVEG